MFLFFVKNINTNKKGSRTDSGQKISNSEKTGNSNGDTGMRKSLRKTGIVSKGQNDRSRLSFSLGSESGVVRSKLEGKEAREV